MKFLHALRRRFLRRRTNTVRFHARAEHLFPEVADRRRRRDSFFKRWNPKVHKGSRFLLALFVPFVIWVFGFSPLFEIRSIQVEGDISVEKEKQEIQIFFEKQLGRNLVFFPSLKEQRIIEKKYPGLKHIHIDKKLFHTLAVDIISYQNVANIVVNDAEKKPHSFVLNEEGRINEENKHLEGLPLIFIREVEGLPSMKDPGVIKPETLKKILEAKISFENKFAMKVTQVHFQKRSREIHLHTEKNFSIWLDAEQDIEAQLHKLKLALAGLDIYKENLEYIDLRITGQDGEKVIYKLRPL